MWKIWHDFLHSILRLKKETGRYCAWQCWQQNFWELKGQNNRKLLSYTWNYNSWDIYIQLSFPSITLTRILVGWSKDDGRAKNNSCGGSGVDWDVWHPHTSMTFLMVNAQRMMGIWPTTMWIMEGRVGKGKGWGKNSNDWEMTYGGCHHLRFYRTPYLGTEIISLSCPGHWSCGCWCSSPVDVNFVLVGSLWGVPKKSMVGQLLHRAKDNGGGGWTPSTGPPLLNRHAYVGCIDNVPCYIKEGRRSGWVGKENFGRPKTRWRWWRGPRMELEQ